MRSENVLIGSDESMEAAWVSERTVQGACGRKGIIHGFYFAGQMDDNRWSGDFCHRIISVADRQMGAALRLFARRYSCGTPRLFIQLSSGYLRHHQYRSDGCREPRTLALQEIGISLRGYSSSFLLSRMKDN